MAPFLFLTALALISLTVLVTLGVDLWINLSGRQTISAWLRQHPLWYFGPLLAIVAFLWVLSLHLLL